MGSSPISIISVITVQSQKVAILKVINNIYSFIRNPQRFFSSSNESNGKVLAVLAEQL